MSLHSDVEALARALGVWCEDTEPLDASALVLMPLHSSLVRVKVGTGRVDVDPPTAAIILLGHARGLRVDIGECPACRERGSMWQRDRRLRPRSGRTLPDTWVPFSGPMQRGHVREWLRPCPECTFDGKPTGRHTQAWERAILDAGPVRKAAPGERGTWQRIGVDGHTEILVGDDPATRTALTVLADQAQTKGDKLGDVLAWWLAGPDVLDRHAYELSCALQAMAVDRHLAAV